MSDRDEWVKNGAYCIALGDGAVATGNHVFALAAAGTTYRTVMSHEEYETIAAVVKRAVEAEEE